MAFTSVEYALLYGYFAKSILTSGNSNSFDILKSCTRRYGVERGRRMLDRARAAGDGSDFDSFIAYADWSPSHYSDFSAEVLEQFPAYSIEVRACGLYDVWCKCGLEEYCQTYCDVFETALAEGFNPDLDLKLPRAMGRQEPFCVFVYNGLSFTLSTLKRINQMQEKLQRSAIRSWEQHSAHLYVAFSQELLRIMGQEEASSLVKKTLVEFGSACSKENVQILLTRAKNAPYVVGAPQ